MATDRPLLLIKNEMSLNAGFVPQIKVLQLYTYSFLFKLPLLLKSQQEKINKSILFLNI